MFKKVLVVIGVSVMLFSGIACAGEAPAAKKLPEFNGPVTTPAQLKGQLAAQMQVIRKYEDEQARLSNRFSEVSLILRVLRTRALNTQKRLDNFSRPAPVKQK